MQIYGLEGLGKVADIPGAVMSGTKFRQEQDAIGEAKKVQNTIWLAGAAKYGLDNYSPETVSALVEEGKRRGVLDPNINPAQVTRQGLMKIYQGARTAAGGVDPRERAATPDLAEFRAAKDQGYKGTLQQWIKESTANTQRDTRTAPQKNFAQRQALVAEFGEGAPEVRIFDNYVRKIPGLEIVEIDRGDGSKISVMYDAQTGRGWTLQGQPITRTPGGYTPAGGQGPQMQPIEPGPAQAPAPQPIPSAPQQPPQAVPMQQGAPMAQQPPQQPPQLGVSPTPGQITTQQETAKADVAAAEDLKQKRIMRIELAKSTVPSMGNLQNVIQQAEDAINSWVPAQGNFAKWLAGVSPFPTPYDDLRSSEKTIQANEAFNRLQQMRDASKTGGALGQVSERELALLAGNYRDLSDSQSEAQYKKNLTEFKQQYHRAMRAWENYLVGEVFVTEGPNGEMIVDKEAFTEYWNSLPPGTYLTPSGYKVKAQ